MFQIYDKTLQMDPNLADGRFDLKPLITAELYSISKLHEAVSKLDVDLVKRIIESGRVNIHEPYTFGQATRTGVKPGHLHQHFCSGRRTSALAQIFEFRNIEDMEADVIWKTIELLEVRLFKNQLIFIT